MWGKCGFTKDNNVWKFDSDARSFKRGPANLHRVRLLLCQASGKHDANKILIFAILICHIDRTHIWHNFNHKYCKRMVTPTCYFTFCETESKKHNLNHHVHWNGVSSCISWFIVEWYNLHIIILKRTKEYE